MPSGSPAWGGLTTSLARAELAAGSFQEAVRLASVAVRVLPGPARRAELYWILAHAQVSEGRIDDGVDTIRQALEQGGMPGDWQARMQVLLSRIERGRPGGFGAAQDFAIRAGRPRRPGGRAGRTRSRGSGQRCPERGGRPL